MKSGWFSGGSVQPADSEKVGFCRVEDDRVPADVVAETLAEGDAVPQEKAGVAPPLATVLPPHPWKLRERRE